LPPREQQSGHVAQVVTRVGDQGERMGQHAERRFDNDEARVQRDPDGECAPEVGGGVAMPAVPMIVVTCHVLLQNTAP